MAEELQNPEGVQEVQEQQDQKIALPIFVKKLDQRYEYVDIQLDNIQLDKITITLNGVIYNLEANIRLRDLLDLFANVKTKEDYIKAIEKINPDILQLNDLIFNNNDDEDDP